MINITKSLYDPAVEQKGEIKGIREAIIIMLTTRFSNGSNAIIQIIQSETNINVLKDWLVKIVLLNSLSDIEKVITRISDNL